MVGKDRKVYVHFKAKNRRLTSAVAKRRLMDIASGAPLYRTIQEPILHPHVDSETNHLLIAINNTRINCERRLVLSVLRAFKEGHETQSV